MKFNETFLHYAITQIWDNWSQFNFYSACLSFPVFAVLVVGILIISIFVDTVHAVIRIF